MNSIINMTPADCDCEISELIGLMEKAVTGDYTRQIEEFTKAGHSESIRRIAEAFGLMLVKIKAREMHLEKVNRELKDVNRRLKKNALQNLITIAHSLGVRDPYTEGHGFRVAEYSQRLAARLGFSPSEVEQIRTGGMLHDIGKIGFSDTLFTNTSDPTPEMLDQIKTHPIIGVAILKDMDNIKAVLDIVHYHHEREDGTGYPYGLAGDEFPVEAKIVGIADTFDALITDRPYQKGKTPVEAFQLLRQMAGISLHRDLVEIFITDIKENGLPMDHAPRRP